MSSLVRSDIGSDARPKIGTLEDTSHSVGLKGGMRSRLGKPGASIIKELAMKPWYTTESRMDQLNEIARQRPGDKFTTQMLIVMIAIYVMPWPFVVTVVGIGWVFNWLEAKELKRRAPLNGRQPGLNPGAH